MNTYNRIIVLLAVAAVALASAGAPVRSSRAAQPRLAPAAAPLPPGDTPGNENWLPTFASAAPNGLIYTLATGPSGELYVGGNFTMIGGITAARMARWNGSQWSALAGGLNARVDALLYGGDNWLYAGGSFTKSGGSPADYIAAWDGSSWHELAALPVSVSAVQALAMDSQARLYAAIDSVSVSQVYRYAGGAWSAVGEKFSLSIEALAFDSQDRLFAGGSFTQYNGSGFIGADSAAHILMFADGRWQGLGGVVDLPVQALTVDGQDNLYIGCTGTSQTGSFPPGFVARWQNGAWDTLNGGVNSQVRALALDGSGSLYAAGNFTTINNTPGTGDDLPAARAARWNGATWSPLGGGLSGLVYALAAAPGSLYAGGGFSQAGGSASKYIAHWTAGDGRCGLQAGGEPYTLYPGSRPVQLAIEQAGTLDCVSIQRHNRSHPNAGTAEQTGAYWEIHGSSAAGDAAAGFSLSLTLPYTTTDSADRLCRFAGSEAGWECGSSSRIDPGTVTREGISQFSQWTVQDNVPTTVTVAAFTARPGDRRVTLLWETAMELDVYGFNLYRSERPDGERRLLTAEPVLPVGGPLTGARYTLVDRAAAPGGAYYYWLDVLQAGEPQQFGPLPALVDYFIYIPTVSIQ
ncbi:MAG: hypothetical protein ACKOC5_14805 [Chloroflexota bacterium]